MKQALASLPNPDETSPHHRVAALGIGQELNGDDAAGVLVARALDRHMAGNPSVMVLDAGPAPENFTGKLRSFAPQIVILIDAAEMSEPPGTVRWLDWRDTSGLSASSHTLPPYVLAGFLAESLGCVVGLIGIQPGANHLGAPVSAAVRRAINGVARDLSRVLGEQKTSA